MTRNARLVQCRRCMKGGVDGRVRVLGCAEQGTMDLDILGRDIEDRCLTISVFYREEEARRQCMEEARSLLPPEPSGAEAEAGVLTCR